MLVGNNRFEAFKEDVSKPVMAVTMYADTFRRQFLDVTLEEEGILYIDRAKLRERLSNASFQGLLGRLSCKPFGDCGTGRNNIYHHVDSKITDASHLQIVYKFIP